MTNNAAYLIQVYFEIVSATDAFSINRTSGEIYTTNTLTCSSEPGNGFALDFYKLVLLL